MGEPGPDGPAEVACRHLEGIVTQRPHREHQILEFEVQVGEVLSMEEMEAVHELPEPEEGCLLREGL